MSYQEGDTCKNCNTNIYRLVRDNGTRSDWRHTHGDTACHIYTRAEPMTNWRDK